MKIEHAMCTNMRFNRINYVVEYIPKLNNLCRYMYIFIAYKYITHKIKCIAGAKTLAQYYYPLSCMRLKCYKTRTIFT